MLTSLENLIRAMFNPYHSLEPTSDDAKYVYRGCGYDYPGLSEYQVTTLEYEQDCSDNDYRTF